MSVRGVRAQRAEEAAQLRDKKGLNGIQIAERMGVSVSYAYELLSDPAGREARRRKTPYRAPCVDCGTMTNPSSSTDEPRCYPCGTEAAAIWTRDAIVCAIQWWADEHGGIPPASTDWQRARGAGDDRVCSVNQVKRRFGTWNAAIRAAGFQPHLSGPVGGFTPLTEAQRRECASRYAAGESSAAIAADLGCAPNAVLKWARRGGAEIREPFGRRAAA